VAKVNGKKIAELRKLRSWNQKTLAAKAQVVPSVISRIEMGLQDDFKVSVVAAVASALETSVDSLLNHAYQPNTGEIVVELQEAIVELSHTPKHIQRQAAGIIRGYLATLSEAE
jgi:transcriptional regulator with XRE-family HTH domain